MEVQNTSGNLNAIREVMIKQNKYTGTNLYITMSQVCNYTDPAWLSLTNERKFVD